MTIGPKGSLPLFQNQMIYTDDFPNTIGWTALSGVSASGGAVTFNDTGTSSLSIGRNFTFPTAKPYCVEVAVTIATGAGQKLFMSLQTTGDIDQLVYQMQTTGGFICNSSIAGDKSQVLTNFVSSTKFKVILWVDPVNKVGKFYLYYKDNTNPPNPGIMCRLQNATTFSYDATIGRILFTTSGPGTGMVTIEGLKIYYPWAVIIGDSVAAGHPGYDPIPGYYITQLRPYSVDSYIEADHTNLVRVINNGLGGDNSTNLAARVQDMVVSMAPKYAILEIGSNDASGTLADYQTRMGTIVDAISAAGIKVVILDIPPRNNLTAPQKQFVLAANAWLPGFCSTKSAIYVPIYNALDDPVNPGNLLPDYTDDNTHPNAAGYRIMANGLRELR